MTIHREGYKTIAVTTLFLGAFNLFFWFSGNPSFGCAFALLTISILFLLFIVFFFRIPSRVLTILDGAIIAPADGKVVVIEETHDVEYILKTGACRCPFS